MALPLFSAYNAFDQIGPLQIGLNTEDTNNYFQFIDKLKL